MKRGMALACAMALGGCAGPVTMEPGTDHPASTSAPESAMPRMPETLSRREVSTVETPGDAEGAPESGGHEGHQGGGDHGGGHP